MAWGQYGGNHKLQSPSYRLDASLTSKHYLVDARACVTGCTCEAINFKDHRLWPLFLCHKKLDFRI